MGDDPAPPVGLASPGAFGRLRGMNAWFIMHMQGRLGILRFGPPGRSAMEAGPGHTGLLGPGWEMAMQILNHTKNAKRACPFSQLLREGPEDLLVDSVANGSAADL